MANSIPSKSVLHSLFSFFVSAVLSSTSLLVILISGGVMITVVAKVPRHAAQENNPAKTASQNNQPVRLLEIRKPIEQEIKGDETHLYRLSLAAGQFLHVVVEQRMIDVVVTLFGPDGKQIIEMDSPNGTQGPEPVLVIVEGSGFHRLQIRSLDQNAKPGRYEVEVKELRKATEQDKRRIVAERALIEAGRLLAQHTAESLLKAIEKYEEFLSFSRTVGDRAREATTLYGIGAVYHSLSEMQKALDYYNKALPVLQEVRDRRGEAITLNNIGTVYNSLGDYQKAMKYYNQALPIRQEVGDRKGEATTLNNMGVVYGSSGDRQKALEYYEQGLKIHREMGNFAEQATTLTNIGAIYGSSGDHQKALEVYSQVLRIIQKNRDRKVEAVVLDNIGGIYKDLGDRQKALEYYDQSLKLKRDTGDREGEAVTLSNIGVYYSSRDNQKALEYFNQALKINRTIGDRAGEATTLNNMGVIYDSSGDRQKALGCYVQSLKIQQDIGDREGEAVTLGNIGIVYNFLNNNRKALEYLYRALKISQELKNREVEANKLSSIGAVYNSTGDYQKALKYYQQALIIRKKVGDRTGEATTLHNIGTLYEDRGDYQKAIKYYTQALQISQETGSRVTEATAIQSISIINAVLGKKQQALKQLDQALLIDQELGDRALKAATLNDKGIVYESLGQKQQALDSYQQAIVTFEDIRAAATIEEIKSGLIGKDASLAYERASLLLIDFGQQAQAFNLTEHARARTFLDQLGNVRPNIHRTLSGQFSKEEEEEALRSDIIALEREMRNERAKPLASLNARKIASLENELARKQSLYEDLLISLKLNNPEYASLHTINPLTVVQVQELLRADTTLLSYFVTKYKTLIFIISRSSFRAVQISVNEADLKAAVTWFRSFASLRDSKQQTLQKLYGLLIAPIQQYIKTPMVGIIPHGVLHYLPFAALTDGKSYFGNEHILFYLPSASVLPFIQNKSKPVGNQMLALAHNKAAGLPVLHYADEEAKAVADLFNTKALTTGDAPKSEFLKRASDYSIIHIAAHAGLNAINPLFSRIWLGQDKDDTGALDVREVYGLDLAKASLVVLSACNTQLGALSKGDDIVGLNRAFIYAGAPTVIASLWTVDDESTSDLMKSFYAHLKQGIGKAEALQAAQSETRKKHPHPYYWASFVLTGDPGPISSNKPRADR